ncbi:hybrid sensor histidine kinase/response regulator transcription factor [Psychroserpens sp. Hel_I_66]|uniref:hybrid sensor histidine kinase/response regulator transcription factor n=1 Tax=Psychroserpens sp. Hel_I_66 TaxID=1250004 RepID=UPI000645FB5D|nr:hybrid sensor histidine kinase/response regulator transcription factor [Psychroserpens sp. Hel_I_66]
MRHLYIALIINFAVFAQSKTHIIDNDESLNFTAIDQELENQWVSSITQDQDGFIWFATQDGLYKYDGYRFFSYRYDPYDPSSLPANWVRHLSQDKNGTFWLSTQGEGLVRFNQEKNSFKKIKSNTIDGIKSSVVFITLPMSNNALWVIGDNGIYRKPANDTVFKKIKSHFDNVFISETKDRKEIVYIDNVIYEYSINEKKLKPIHEGVSINRLLVNSKNELVYRNEGTVYINNLKNEPRAIDIPEHIWFISNIQNNKCVFVSEKHMYSYDFNTDTLKVLNYDSTKIHSAEINNLYLDSQDIIWIATRTGVFKENKAGNVFLNTIDVHARRIIEDKDKLYIGGIEGLHCYSKIDKTYKTLIAKTPIFSVLKTEDGIWAGDMYGKVYFLDKNHKVSSYPLEKNSNTFLKLYGIVEDRNGFIWVSSWEGIYLLNKKGEILERYKLNTNENNKDLKAIQLHLDKSGNLWVLTIGNGLFVIPKIAEVSGKQRTLDYKQYTHVKGKLNSLNSNVLYEIHEDFNGTIWIGSDFGINKYNLETDNFEILKTRHHDFDKKVMAIKTDSNNLLWISTIRDGIFIYDKEKKSLINLRETDGLNSNACLFTSSHYNGKELYFGTENGIQIINPNNLITPNIDKIPVITNFTVLGEESFKQKASILNNQTIKLNHKQTDISVDFSLHDYRFPEKINYYYILENSHDDWRKASNNRVSYTNLEPGEYNFLIKASYQSEVETPTAKLELIISSPWYKTTLAYILFSTLFISLVYLFLHLRLKQKMTLDRLEIAKEMDRIKSNLFTNISHELRTPLTLISGPIEHQLSKKNLDSEDRKELNLVKQNANRLLNLVNQMLDLSLIDSGQLRLFVEEGNLNMLLNQIVDAFQYKADEKQIRIISQIQNLSKVWYDVDLIEKITSNLLSNAIKYAPENTEILLDANDLDNILVLSIINVNTSISQKDFEKLFQRFYQDNEASEGVGVGLALVKELVNLSKGNITANTLEHDKVQFTVSLPISKNAFNASEIKTETPHIPSIEQLDLKEKIKTDKPLLLIAEDDKDIRTFVVSMFKEDYKIIEAENGKTGIDLALQYIPDIIISDIMMPVQDGIELCNFLKYNELTSHIPIILLTAKVGETNEIVGLKTGADAYITKPFNREKLILRVEKLIENRQKLQLYFSKDFTIHPELPITSTEKDFLKRLKIVLDNKITDPDFTSEAFADAMLMSRTQLHRKLKAIVGMTTSEFLRNQRLKLAIELLKKSDATVSEIAYQVGFNTPSYFIKCFKSMYNCTPSEYISE